MSKQDMTTPRPWAYDICVDNDDGQHYIWVYSPSSDGIVKFPKRPGGQELERDDDNAELIVTAVNSHAALSERVLELEGLVRGCRNGLVKIQNESSSSYFTLETIEAIHEASCQAIEAIDTLVDSVESVGE